MDEEPTRLVPRPSVAHTSGAIPPVGGTFTFYNRPSRERVAAHLAQVAYELCIIDRLTPVAQSAIRELEKALVPGASSTD